jgi:hypothetical protein
MWLLLFSIALPVAVGLLSLKIQLWSDQSDDQPPHMGF